MTELKEEVVEGRKFKTIDFILPGQLRFSLLAPEFSEQLLFL
ncbi:MAG: hypothetical protein R2942_09460 [Ignavibacteria bacterium]